MLSSYGNLLVQPTTGGQDERDLPMRGLTLDAGMVAADWTQRQSAAEL